MAQPFSQPGADPEAAIRVRGAHFISATTSDGTVRFDDPQRIGRVPVNGTRPLNVLVEFDNHTTALLPVLPDHITDITVQEREIAAVIGGQQRIDFAEPTLLAADCSIEEFCVFLMTTVSVIA